MKFRGLQSKIVERDEQGRPRRRETIVTTVFSMGYSTGAVTDARPLWSLMAQSFTGATRRSQSVVPELAEQERRFSSAP